MPLHETEKDNGYRYNGPRRSVSILLCLKIIQIRYIRESLEEFLKSGLVKKSIPSDKTSNHEAFGCVEPTHNVILENFR